jgi:hypothetical protein
MLLIASGAAGAEPASRPAAGESTVNDVKLDLEPTRVSGKVKDAPADQLFAEIARLGHVTFVEKPNGLLRRPPLDAANFSAEFDKQPLWDAVREACEAAKLHPGPGGSNSDRDAIGLSEHAIGPCSVDGPVLVRAANVRRLKDQKTVRAELEVAVEPRLMPFASVGETKIARAADDAEHEFAAAREAKVVGPAYFGVRTWPTVHVLLTPPAEAGKAMELKGTVAAQVAPRVAVAEIGLPLAKAIDVAVGEDTLTVQPIAPLAGNETLEVEMSLARGEKTDDARWKALLDATARQPGRARVTLSAGDENYFQRNVRSDFDGKHINWRFEYGTKNMPPQPERLRVMLPAEMKTIEAAFALKAIPLP